MMIRKVIKGQKGVVKCKDFDYKCLKSLRLLLLEVVLITSGQNTSGRLWHDD